MNGPIRLQLIQKTQRSDGSTTTQSHVNQVDVYTCVSIVARTGRVDLVDTPLPIELN